MGASKMANATDKQKEYSDLHCLASLSKARDILHEDATYNGNNQSMEFYKVLTQVQDTVWVQYHFGHPTVHTVKTDQLKITTYNTADKAIAGIKNHCKAYINL